MPLYNYRCENCGAEFTKLMAIKEREDKDTNILCPECGCSENTPMVSKTSFSLKGKGWYKDGYTKENN